MRNKSFNTIRPEVRFLQNLCIILLIMFIYRIPRSVSNIFLIDIPVEEIFWILPSIFLVTVSIYYKTFRLPYFLIFVIIETWFLLSESEIFRPGREHDLLYAYYLLQFYSVFISFIAYG